jgi:hypothetical protein
VPSAESSNRLRSALVVRRRALGTGVDQDDIGLCHALLRANSGQQTPLPISHVGYDDLVEGVFMWAKCLWLFFRYARWLLWLATIGYSIEFLFHRQEHFNVFGQLLLTTEFWMFSLPFAAVFAVCLELMMRERAGITRSADHKVGLDR